MFNSGSLVRAGRIAVLLLVVAGTLSGCKSRQEQALDQAKAQAAKTGQAQQVVSVDKNGTTTTTVVQPPAAGQTGVANITVTVSDGTATATSVFQLTICQRPAAPGSVRIASSAP